MYLTLTVRYTCTSCDRLDNPVQMITAKKDVHVDGMVPRKFELEKSIDFLRKLLLQRGYRLSNTINNMYITKFSK